MKVVRSGMRAALAGNLTFSSIRPAKAESSRRGSLEWLRYKFKLTVREVEVVYWAVHGKTNPEISFILGSTPDTVKHQLNSVYKKMGGINRIQLTALVSKYDNLTHVDHWLDKREPHSF